MAESSAPPHRTESDSDGERPEGRDDGGSADVHRMRSRGMLEPRGRGRRNLLAVPPHLRRHDQARIRARARQDHRTPTARRDRTAIVDPTQSTMLAVRATPHLYPRRWSVGVPRLHAAGGKVTPARRPATFGVPRNELRCAPFCEKALICFLTVFAGRFQLDLCKFGATWGRRVWLDFFRRADG